MIVKLFIDFEYFSLVASTVDRFTGSGAIRVHWASCGRGFVVVVSALLVFGGCASAVSPIFVGDYYRDAAITATGVVYHSGFSLAHTEADLAPL